MSECDCAICGRPRYTACPWPALDPDFVEPEFAAHNLDLPSQPGRLPLRPPTHAVPGSGLYG